MNNASSALFRARLAVGVTKPTDMLVQALRRPLDMTVADVQLIVADPNLQTTLTLPPVDARALAQALIGAANAVDAHTLQDGK